MKKDGFYVTICNSRTGLFLILFLPLFSQHYVYSMLTGYDTDDYQMASVHPIFAPKDEKPKNPKEQFTCACDNKDTETALRLIEEHKDIVNDSWMHSAVCYNNLKAAEKLLSVCPSLDTTTALCSTLYFTRIKPRYFRPEMVKLFMQHGADPHKPQRGPLSCVDEIIQNERGFKESKRRVLLAIVAPHLVTPEFLEESYQKERMKRRNKALVIACRYGDIRAATKLLQKNPDLAYRHNERTALEEVIHGAYYEIDAEREAFRDHNKIAFIKLANLLLDQGIETYRPSLKNYLSSAIVYLQPELAQLLIEYGSDDIKENALEKIKNQHVVSIFQFSPEIKINFLFTLQAPQLCHLLEKRIENRCRTIEACNPEKTKKSYQRIALLDDHFLYGCFTNNLGYLAEHFPQSFPQHPIYDLGNCLHIATRLGQFEITRIILEKNGAVQKKLNSSESPLGRTPLHNAVLSQSPELISLLVAHGADGSKKDMLDNTPADMIFKYKPVVTSIPLERKRALLSALGTQRIVQGEVAF